MSESRYFDIDTYAEMIDIELKMQNGDTNRIASQKDIDTFLL